MRAAISTGMVDWVLEAAEMLGARPQSIAKAEDRSLFKAAMEKIGGRLTDRIDITQLPAGPAVHVIYEIDRASFAAGPLSA